jgi:hypothetical protein
MSLLRIRNLGFFLCGLFAVVLVTSCSTRNASFSSLANQGLIPVSADSPFVGANLYLAKEMEDSLYLYSFLRSRGSPRAIEITGNSEKSAELHLFYPAKQEVYHATPQRDPLTKAKEWIVRGPYAIDRSLYRSVTQLGTETSGVFEIFGRREHIGGPAQARQERVIEPAFVPTPTPIPTPRPRAVKKPQASDSASGPSILVQGTPMNFDQEAILESKRPTAASGNPQVTPAVPSPATKTAPKKSILDEALKATVLSSPTGVPSATKPPLPRRE